MITFFLPVLKYIKKYAIIIIIIVLLLLSAKWAYNEIKFLRAEKARSESNLENMKFELDSTKTKNDELVYSVNSLTVKPNELKFYDKEIVKRLDEMNLKIKNLQSVTNLNYNYTTNIDTIKSKLVSENKFLASWNTGKNIDFSGFINIPKNYPNFTLPNDFSKIDTLNAQYPYLTNVKVIFNDTLLIVPEYTYKRRWIFWKKLTGLKLNIKSENPNFKLDKIQTYQINK